MKLLLLHIVLLFSLAALAADPKVPEKFTEGQALEYLQGVDTTQFDIPADIKYQAYIALQHYPDLQDKKIKFRYKNLKTTMACMPRWDFLFRKKENRTYLISIDKKLKKDKGVLLSEVPFNAQVGVIGHELGHVADYENKSSFGVIGTGFRYLFPGYRRKLENQIDELTIDRGLGTQVADFADYVFHESNANEKYIRYKRKYYYSPAELQSLVAGASLGN